MKVPEHSRKLFQKTMKLLTHKSLYFFPVQLIFNQRFYTGKVILDEFHLRWLIIKGFRVAFPISITLFVNHLNWDWSKTFLNLKIFWSNLRFDNKSLIKLWTLCLIKIMFWTLFWYQSLSNYSRLATRGGK